MPIFKRLHLSSITRRWKKFGHDRPNKESAFEGKPWKIASTWERLPDLDETSAEFSEAFTVDEYVIEVNGAQSVISENIKACWDAPQDDQDDQWKLLQRAAYQIPTSSLIFVLMATVFPVWPYCPLWCRYYTYSKNIF